LTLSLPLKKPIKAALLRHIIIHPQHIIPDLHRAQPHIKISSSIISTKAIMQFTTLLTTTILALSVTATPSIKERQSVAATGTLWTTGGCSGAASTSGFEIPTGGCTAFPTGTESGEFSGIVFGCTRT
jgi:hypothetical protein